MRKPNPMTPCQKQEAARQRRITWMVIGICVIIFVALATGKITLPAPAPLSAPWFRSHVIARVRMLDFCRAYPDVAAENHLDDVCTNADLADVR
jgi:hypothetical protein